MEGHFVDGVPHHCFATDDLEKGLRWFPKSEALGKRYIQVNPRKLVRYLVFDIDHPCAIMAAHEGLLPPPSLAVLSPHSGRGHLYYPLADPVPRSDFARLQPLRYLRSIERGLVRRLDADPGYSGFVAKNPVHPSWRLVSHPTPPYRLRDLAAHLHDINMRAFPTRPSGLGRNVTLFDSLRHEAYRSMRQSWVSADELFNELLRLAVAINREFFQPLPMSEVRASVKSISAWVHRRFSPAAFSRIQSERALRLGQIRRAARDAVLLEIRRREGRYT